MDLVKVASFPSRIEAGIAGGVLESNGITYVIRGDDIGIFGPGHQGASIFGVDLLVGESDVPEARRLLADAGLIEES
jgi:hypothetical protein